MNKKQLTAIAKLEEVMKELKSCGLALAGVDDSLLCFQRKQFDKATKDKKTGWNLSPSQVMDKLDYVIIDCPYIDSGGA